MLKENPVSHISSQLSHKYSLIIANSVQKKNYGGIL